MPSPMSATPNRDPLTISIMRLMPAPGSWPSARPGHREPAPTRDPRLAPSSATSPVGTPTVPSFGLSRLMRKPFGLPSSSRRGTMNVARPRAPSGAPSGRASTMNTSASTFEQKCFSPWRRHSSPSGTARVVFAPTSLPPWRSVRNMPPSHASSGSRLVSRPSMSSRIAAGRSARRCRRRPTSCRARSRSRSPPGSRGSRSPR